MLEPITPRASSSRVERGAAFLEVAYAGIGFELLASGSFGGLSLQEEHASFSCRPDAAPTLIARVRCAVRRDPRLLMHGEREIRCEWEQDRAVVRTGAARASLRQLAVGEYAGSAVVGPEGFALSALVTALSGAIVYRERGIVLHASGIVRPAGAVLFIGPSGAGKTTSANLCGGSTWMARDRAAVVTSSAGTFAWGMAGGDPIELPQHDVRGVPLAAILRVAWSDGDRGPSIERASLPHAVAVLRESMQSIAEGAGGEVRGLDTLLGLASRVPVGIIHTRLGAPLSALLDEWLGRGAR